MRKRSSYLKNVYRIGLWNTQIEEEYHEEVTEYLFSNYKIYPIFMESEEIKHLRNGYKLLKYVCYNNTLELKKQFLENQNYLEESWDAIKKFNLKTLEVYKKIISKIN